MPVLEISRRDRASAYRQAWTGHLPARRKKFSAPVKLRDYQVASGDW